MTQLFNDFRNITYNYTGDQLDQGVWQIFGGSWYIWNLFDDTSISDASWQQCIRSAANLHRSYVFGRQLPDGITAYYMLWDTMSRRIPPRFVPTALEAIGDVLRLNDQGCQQDAIYALGEFAERGHPGPEGILARFLEGTSGLISPASRDAAENLLRWIRGREVRHG